MIVAVIPARGGSKRIKGKNIKTGEIEEFKGVFERVKKKKTKK